MQLASHNSSASTNGMTWLKSHIFTWFWSLWPNEYNVTIDNTISITNIWLDIA